MYLEYYESLIEQKFGHIKPYTKFNICAILQKCLRSKPID